MRSQPLNHKIAILNTGDEICQGDITNTNSQEIALKLVDHGLQINVHMSVPDRINEIENAIKFLLQNHDALIITGGLGPTSDDLTRYALANAVGKELVFDTQTWENICARLKKFGYNQPPDSNKQQALFPEGATIIANERGTAAGCIVYFDNKFIFMLPGPPAECLPIIDTVVIPNLVAANFQQKFYRKKWLLFGVGEGQIAEVLDETVKNYDCTTGYRIWYPYIEFKIISQNQSDFEKIIPLIEKQIAPYVIGDGSETASALLKKYLVNAQQKIFIDDQATGGALAAALLTPNTKPFLVFDKEEKEPFIKISGLNEFWLAENTTHAQISIALKNQEQKKELEFNIPFRGKRILLYAVEYICRYIYEFLPSILGNTDNNLNKN